MGNGIRLDATLHDFPTPSLHLIFFRNLAAPGKDLRFCAGGFGFFDVAGAIVK